MLVPKFRLLCVASQIFEDSQSRFIGHPDDSAPFEIRREKLAICNGMSGYERVSRVYGELTFDQGGLMEQHLGGRSGKDLQAIDPFLVSQLERFVGCLHVDEAEVGISTHDFYILHTESRVPLRCDSIEPARFQ